METAPFFKAVLEASWQGSLVILLLLLLRPLLGLRVPARWRSLLWMLVLLRLLVPAFLLPPSPASLQNLAVVDRPIEEAGRAMQSVAPVEAPPSRVRTQGPDGSETLSAGPAAAVPATPPARHAWWRIAAGIWVAGGALTGLWILAATLLLYRRLRHDSAEPDEDIRAVWERCCARLAPWSAAASVSATPPSHARAARAHAARPPAASSQGGVALTLPAALQGPRLVQTSAVNSPALVGAFRPILLIPRHGCETLSEEDWEHIFLHELAHFRRRDHWLQALQLVALCAHWFNPLVWFGFRCLRADRELAADEWALRHLERDRPAAYGETLLKVLTAQSRSTMTPGLVGIMEDGTQMQQRLRHIVAFAPRRLVGTLAGLAVVLACAALVLGRQTADLAGYAGLSPAESLVVAARHSDRGAVEQLLADGVEVNAVTNLRGERTALTAAVAAHAEEIIRLLVAKGADVNFTPEQGQAPIVIALRQGRRATVEYLRERGAACDAETLASARGDAAAVQAYLASGEPAAEKVKLLAEVAAAHGHAALYGTLFEATRSLSNLVAHRLMGSALSLAVARGQRSVIEEMLRLDPRCNGGGVIRLAGAAAPTPGLREWMNERGFEIPLYHDGERLIDAAERENLPEMRRLLAAGADVNYRGESDWTPLSKAATWGCPRAVKLLLEHHADPNPRKHGYSTLALAKTPEIAGMLFAAGARPQPVDIEYPALHGSREVVQWFLDHGIDPRKLKSDEMDATLLFSAGKPEIAELLIARGVEVNARNKRGDTALIQILQMRENPAEIVALLLKHGADPNLRRTGGYTPLMSAPDGATVDVLVAAGADLQARNDRGETALAVYVPLVQPSREEALRRHGLQPDASESAALLIHAIHRHAPGEVKALLARGTDPHSGPLEDGRRAASPLSVAIFEAEWEIVALLRAAGAKDVGALSEAAARGDLGKMRTLLDAGAAVDELTHSQMTPLQFAVRAGQTEAVRLLLERGAKGSAFDSYALSARALARTILLQIEHKRFSPIRGLEAPEAHQAMTAIVALLGERKPDPDWRNLAGETALMVAAQVGNSITLEDALESGANLNAQRADGMTALMLAIATQPRNAALDGPGSVEVPAAGQSKPARQFSARGHFVKILLDRGADVTLRNATGRTALDLALEKDNAEIRALLNAAGHRP